VAVSAATAEDNSVTIAEFVRGSDQDLLKQWSVPESYRSTVTRLDVAVVLIEDGTSRVLRINHDVCEKPAEARVCLDARRSALAIQDFQSIAIRHRALRYYTHFQVVLLDQAGREIPGPVLHAGPDHWRTDTLQSSAFEWPESKSERLSGIILVIRQSDDNRKGTLLIQWIQWR
ncbi:MAG: hypothetical protein ABIH23_14845, partial [bacterium]